MNQLLTYGNNQISIPASSRFQIYSKHNTINCISVFSKEEQYKLQSFLLNDIDSYKLGIYICMFTGLRLGEICALKTENINLSTKVIFVNQTVQRIKSDKSESKTQLLVSKPKTINSVREVPVCDLLLNVLEKNMSHNTYLVNGNKLMEPRTYQYFFHRALKDLAIEEKNFHSLRHTFATNCIDSGMDPKCLSEILGHADIKTTLNKYVHPTFEQKIKQINSLASNYGQKNGQI